MRVLVTGGSGLVGRHVVRSLKNTLDVEVLDLRSFPDDSVPSRIIDILDLNDVTRAAKDFDAVVHLAGIPIPLNHPPEKVFQVNAVGTFNVLEACARNRIRHLIFMSSESTLGIAFGEGKIEPVFIPVDESHPLRPIDPYGLSKITAERLCEAYSRKSGMSILSLRAPWIWVPEEEERRTYADLVKNYASWKTALWAHIHVDDVADAIRCGLNQSGSPSGHRAYFISAGTNWTGRDTRDLVREFFPGAKLLNPDRPGPYSLINGALANKELGFSASRNPLDIVNR